jgi:hypothetical protein
LLQAWAHNPATANHVVDASTGWAPPQSRCCRNSAQLALPRRGGRFASIDNDEELQRLSRAIIGRLS